MEIIKSSKQLLKLMDDCKNRFERMNQKPEKTESLFYNEVRPTFELVMDLANEWKTLAFAWVLENNPKYIHQAQIESTIENMEQVVLQSYYKDVNNQRFHNLHNSIEYIITSILDDIKERD